jgi:hypothetical protein
LSATVQPADLATFDNGSFLATYVAESRQRQASIIQARAVASLQGT